MIYIKGRNIQNGEKVFVYYNLHKKCFSIKALEGQYKGYVVAHSEEVVLSGGQVEFIVYEKGRQMVLSKKQKNVHAGLIGNIDITNKKHETTIEVTYDPYKFDSFVRTDNLKPVTHAKTAVLRNKRVYI